MRIIRELIEFHPQSKRTNITQALRYLSNVMKKKVILFILSDFMDDDYDNALKIIGKKHDVTGIRVFDKYEKEMPKLGMVSMQDAESGKIKLVNTNSKVVRTGYKAHYLKMVDYFENSFKKSGSGTISTRIDEGYVKKLLGYFKRRN